MSESNPRPAAPSSPRPESKGLGARLGIDGIVLAALTVLALAGLAIADFSAQFAFRYWLVMVPVFAGASIFAGWSRARDRGDSAARILRQQLLHWASLPLAIYVIYLLQTTGRLNREDAGLVALLALAVTTFLAGVHFDWRLAVLGGMLGAGAVASAMVEEFFWVLLIPLLVAGAVGVLWRKRSG